jgi:hypothetical protein
VNAFISGRIQSGCALVTCSLFKTELAELMEAPADTPVTHR